MLPTKRLPKELCFSSSGGWANGCWMGGWGILGPAAGACV